MATDITTLVTGCKRGQATAQKELVRRFAAALLSVARRYCRAKSQAEDVLQDSFVLIFKKIDQYDPAKGSVGTWMRRIVIHTALANFRRLRYDLEISADSLPDTNSTEPDVFSKLDVEVLLKLIAELPDGAREVFNMAVFDEFSHEEIGEALGIPVGTSRSLLSRARKQLQLQILKLQENELVRI